MASGCRLDSRGTDCGRRIDRGPRAPVAQHPRDANLVRGRFIGTIPASQLVIGPMPAPDLSIALADPAPPSAFRALLREALDRGRDVLVPAVVCAEACRGSARTRRVETALARHRPTRGQRAPVVVVDTDFVLARQVGAVLHGAGAESADLAGAHVVAVAVGIATGHRSDRCAVFLVLNRIVRRRRGGAFNWRSLRSKARSPRAVARDAAVLWSWPTRRRGGVRFGSSASHWIPRARRVRRGRFPSRREAL